MNFNNPDYRAPRLDPITYHLEEYEPQGMDGIFITEAWLDIDVDRDGDPVICGVSFPADRKPNSMIPAAFEKALIQSMNADRKLMEYICEACMEEYANNH